MKMKYIVYVLLIVGFGSLAAYRLTKTAGAEAGGKQGGTGQKGGAVVPVEGVVVKPTAFTNALSVTGALQAEQEVKIISQTAGLVTKLFFKEGSTVQKGQVLVAIDNTELEARLAEAMTNEGLAGETEKRAALLIRSGAISQQEYDAAGAGLKSMKAQTQLINAQLAKTQIRAPFSGTIGLSTVAVGQYLSPADMIANLVSSDPIRITFSVPEKYASNVAINTVLQFTIAGSEKVYTAKVYAIEPAIDPATRTLQLKARTANPGGTLLPGAFAQVALPVSVIKDALLVPSEAIIPVQNGQKIFIKENGAAKEVRVQGATRTDKAILITEGIKAGDTVITSGNMSLKEGTKVKVTITGNQ